MAITVVTFEGILISLRTTSNFLTAVLMYIDKKPRYVKFNNGFAGVLSWSEYLHFRHLTYLGFGVRRVDNSDDREYYKRIGFSLPVYVAEKKGYKILFDRSILVVLGEPLEKEYTLDVKGKNVLDVGAYKGETAVWFKILGAKNLVLYEPGKENIPILKFNLVTNHIAAEVHEKRISERNISDVLQNSNCEIAKFDCEGAEIGLANVDGKTLRMLEGYEIECHSPDVRNTIAKKFISEKFKLTHEYKCNDVTSVLCFQR